MTRNSENIISRHDCSTLLTTFTVQSNFVIVLTYLSQLTERLLFLCFVITMYTYPSLSPTATYCTTVLEKNNKFIFYTRSTTILRYNNTFRKPSPLKFSPIKKNFLVFVEYGSSYPKNTLIRDDKVPDSVLKKKNWNTRRKNTFLSVRLGDI